MISIIVPTYKNPTCLDILIQSIVDSAAKSDFEMIVMIDGYIDMYDAVIAKYKYDWLKVHGRANNVGMAMALNNAVSVANGDYILVINDDNVMPPNWLSNINELIANDSDDTKRVITLNQIERHAGSIFGFIHHDCGDFDNFNYLKYIDYVNSCASNEIVDHDGGIFPFLMKKKWYMVVGGFDVIYDSPFMCDWDFFLKLEMLGCTFHRATSVILYHFGSVSTKRNPTESEQFKAGEQQAAQIFIYKWGFNPTIQPITNSHRPGTGIIVRGVTF